MHPGKEWVIAQGSSLKCYPRVTHLEFLAPGFTLPNSSHYGHLGIGRPVSILEINKIIYIHFSVLSNYFICYSHYTDSFILWRSLNLNPTSFKVSLQPLSIPQSWLMINYFLCQTPECYWTKIAQQCSLASPQISTLQALNSLYAPT